MNQLNFKWKDPDTSDKNLFEVDVLLASSFDFFAKLEKNCMAECCGIGAFSFEPVDVLNASNDLDKSRLVADLERAIRELHDRKEKTVVSARINNLFDKSTFIHLLEYIVAILRPAS